MELAYAFLARAAQFSEDGGLEIVGGDVQSLWGTVPFSPDALTLVAKLELGQEEVGQRHVVRVDVLDPTGRQLAQTGLEFDAPGADRHDKIGAILLIDLTEPQFIRPGLHQIRFSLDDRLLKTLELEIFADLGVAENAASA